MLEKSLLTLASLWIVFWSITWVYDQTRTGKRNIQNVIYATLGCIVLIGYFLLKLINE